MKTLFLIIMIVLTCGCAAIKSDVPLQGAIEKMQEQAKNIEEVHQANALLEAPVVFVDSPNSPRVYDMEHRSLRQAQLVALINPIALYVVTTGEWPDSWDDLRNDYVPFLPVDPETGLEYDLLNLSDLGSTAPAGSIVADWADDGCNIYTAKPGKDDWDFAIENNDWMQKAVNVLKTMPGKNGEIGAGFDDPAYRLIISVKALTEANLSHYWAHNRELPSHVSGLLRGFKINPDFNPGFDNGEAGERCRFTIATLPEEDKYYFMFTLDVPNRVAYNRWQVYGEHFLERKAFKFSETPRERFTLLLTEAAFLGDN